MQCPPRALAGRPLRAPHGHRLRAPFTRYQRRLRGPQTGSLLPDQMSGLGAGSPSSGPPVPMQSAGSTSRAGVHACRPERKRRCGLRMRRPQGRLQPQAGLPRALRVSRAGRPRGKGPPGVPKGRRRGSRPPSAHQPSRRTTPRAFLLALATDRRLGRGCGLCIGPDGRDLGMRLPSCQGVAERSHSAIVEPPGAIPPPATRPYAIDALNPSAATQPMGKSLRCQCRSFHGL